ncbi:type VI secretion system baseplate subunit TssE [Bowmanella sp. Y26]|uniref:type VI secretion system baseplate subunit TssE n=1 Tax=Bowmanella yangjiangensis TaxID=2811230 RepID=UPI001BDD276C|nr:type VI secretion system baseplate subunit TssE [Bowmanella yangjiangensis]MBT1063895.1 type VI secretion system baseplate subunit TssE [Bowmanella yangjiangensis]
MAELFQQHKLQPSLLDRLTDDVLMQQTPQGESHKASDNIEKFYISTRKLREVVIRDLSWLLNTVNLESVEDLSAYPLVAKSVVNYGVPELTGSIVSQLDASNLQKQLHRIILCYEPRILPSTLNVRVKKTGQMSRNALRFEIECDIWGQPVPEHLSVQSELDLDTGAITLHKQKAG